MNYGKRIEKALDKGDIEAMEQISLNVIEDLNDMIERLDRIGSILRKPLPHEEMVHRIKGLV